MLKGGLLLFALAKAAARSLGRPTKDVDLRADGVVNEPGELHTIFAEICKVALPDGVVFDIGAITAEPITEDADYQGVRVHVPVRLAGARGRVQIDIGFGDIVTPGPRSMDFPVLLEGMSVPSLQVYSNETVVSEKFEAMISLSLVNSRLKDFYDIYQLAHAYRFSGSSPQQAVRNTFRRRGTDFRPNPAIFQDSFAIDLDRQRQWRVFLNRTHLTQAPSAFVDVTADIGKFLWPVHDGCIHSIDLAGEWDPDRLAWR
jgi:hypothetical protein